MTREIVRLLLVSLLLTSAAAIATAQERAPNRPQNQRPPGATANSTVGQTSADENFELNITEKRITEENFAASTAVEAGDESARGLRLRVGVGVGADNIEVLLRNVRGHVRFRGTLERVLKLIGSKPATNNEQ
jgi:hypothetical protein